MKNFGLVFSTLVALSAVHVSKVAAQTVPPTTQIQRPAPQSAKPSTNSEPTSQPLTLKEAEAIALKNNPQISVGKLLTLISQQNVRETRSALLPTANMSVTGVESRSGSRIAAGALNNPVVYPRAAAGVGVSQLIYDFGRTSNLVSSSEYQAKAQNELETATTAQILLAVDQAFFNALETEALVRVAQQTLNTRQTFVDKIGALTNSKLKSDLDLSFANVDRARAQLQLLEARNNYEAALNNLSAILGYQDTQNFQPVEEPTQETTPVPDVNPLVMQALQQRPEIQALSDQVTAAEKTAVRNMT